jgi:urease accessory protein UreH
VLLNDLSQWAGNEKTHRDLVALRNEITHNFKRYFHDNAMLDMTCQRYWLALQAARMHITGTVLEVGKNKHSASQADRRKGKGKALTTVQENRAVSIYRDRVRDGEKYGAIRDLAKQFKTSETTIKSLVKRAD